MTSRGNCTIDGCERPVKARGWCRAHYAAQWRRGLDCWRYTRHAVALKHDRDPVVIDRLVSGEQVPFTSWERREAVRRLVGGGMSKRGAARYLGIASRQVYRDLERVA